MKTAKTEIQKVVKRRSADEIRRAFEERAEKALADGDSGPSYVWQVVAINMDTIEKLRFGGKDWDDIAEHLRLASGFPNLAGQSVRVNVSRLRKGHYDHKIGALGLCRVGKRILPISAAPMQAEADVEDPNESTGDVRQTQTSKTATETSVGAGSHAPTRLHDTPQNSREAPVKVAEGEQSEGGGTGSASFSQEATGREPSFAIKADPILKRTRT